MQFKYYDDKEDVAGLDDSEMEEAPIDLIHAHMDPFYNECRAFGRIIEANLNGKIAVHCFGYITIPAEKEEELRQRFNVGAWGWPVEDSAKEGNQREPFRAIVKELIRHDTPFTEKLFKKILRDLKRMRRLGVYPMDVEARNYKGGLLLDMGVAMTNPHFLFDIKPAWQVRYFQLDDLTKYENMARDSGVSKWPRALRNEEYCTKLRPARKLGTGSKPGTAMRQ